MADTKPTPVAAPEEVARHAEEQTAEYGTFVAVAPISFNGTPAYNVGDPVPVSNVKKFGYDSQGLVEKVGSAAANKVVSAIHASGANSEPSAELPQAVSLGVPVK